IQESIITKSTVLAEKWREIGISIRITAQGIYKVTLLYTE
ncbi:unnamed protein product, partial [marine sediment metagenome]